MTIQAPMTKAQAVRIVTAVARSSHDDVYSIWHDCHGGDYSVHILSEWGDWHEDSALSAQQERELIDWARNPRAWVTSR